MIYSGTLMSYWLLANMHPALPGTVTTDITSQVVYSDDTGVYYDELPDDIPDNVQVIKLTGNQLTSLETCPVFELLLEMDLTDNNLLMFPNLLNASSLLRNLYLGRNSISHIEPEHLDCLSNLQILIMSENLLSFLPDVPGPSDSLVKVYLDNNRFTALPGLENLGRSLRLLDMSANAIKEINASSLVNLPAIQKLDITSNLMTTFPDLQPVGATLRILTMTRNKIRVIPIDVLNSLQKLQRFFMGYTATLEEVPDFSHSPSRHTLEYLSLPANAITNVPLHTLSELTAIKAVTLRFNPLTTLPNLCHAPVVPFAISMPRNTLICDCHLRWIKLVESFGLSVQDNASPCASPPGLVGIAWSSLTLDNFTCEGFPTKHSYTKALTSVFRCPVNAIVQWLHTNSKMECAGFCLQFEGCHYFQYGRPNATDTFYNCGLSDVTTPIVNISADIRRETWYSLD